MSTPSIPHALDDHILEIWEEATENLVFKQFYLAYNGFRAAVFARLGARDDEHHDSLPAALQRVDWLGLGEQRGRALSAALAHDYSMARIMGGCYHETFRDLYGDEETARNAQIAAETILARCAELELPES